MDDEPGPFYNREGMILTGSVFQMDTFKTLFVDHFFNTAFLQMGYWTKNSFKTLFKLAGYSDLNCCPVLHQQCVCKPLLNHVLNLSNSLLQGWLSLSILGTSTYYRLPPCLLGPKYASPPCGYHHHFSRVFKLHTWRSQPPKCRKEGVRT